MTPESGIGTRTTKRMMMATKRKLMKMISDMKDSVLGTWELRIFFFQGLSMICRYLVGIFSWGFPHIYLE